MRIFVTGSEGLLMRAVIPTWLQQGAAIEGLDVVAGKARSYRTHWLNLCEDPGQVADAIEEFNPEYIVHSAAMVLGAGAIEAKRAEALIGNTLSSAVMADAIRTANLPNLKRIVYLSSSCVYDNCTPPAPESAVDAVRPPDSGYGLSKWIGEQFFKALAAKRNIPYTFWRPFNIVSPFERPKAKRGDGHVIADLIEAIAVQHENPVALYGGGVQTRCFTWYEDVAKAVAHYSFHAATENEAVNLGTPEPVLISDLARIIFLEAKRRGMATGDFAIQTVARPSTDVQAHVPHVEKAKRLIGWEPTVHLREMIERCFDDRFGKWGA